MTIAIGIAVPEGLVLAADSRATYPNPRSWPRIATDYADKVFQLSESAGATTFGWAMLNGRSIKSHVIDLAHEFRESPLDEIRPRFCEYFQGEYELHIAQNPREAVGPGRLAFGFLLAGYTEGGVGEIYECLFPGNPHGTPQHSTQSPGAVWQGQIDIVTRLILGRDPRLDLTQLPDGLRDGIRASEYIIYFARLVLQDAVDLAILLVRTTIGVQRFTDGIRAAPGDLPGVGGCVDVAVITRNEGFQWIQRKQLHGENP